MKFFGIQIQLKGEVISIIMTQEQRKAFIEIFLMDQTSLFKHLQILNGKTIQMIGLTFIILNIHTFYAC